MAKATGGDILVKLIHEVTELRSSMTQVADHARKADATLERIARLLKGVADRLEEHA